MSEGWWVALGTFLTAFGAVLGTALKGLHDRRREKIKDAVAQCQEVIAQYQGLVGRQDRQLDEQQKSIGWLHERQVECEAECGELYGYLLRSHDFSCHLAQALKDLGHDPGAVPQPPPRKKRTLSSVSEYVARTTSHATGMVHKVGRPPEAQPQQAGEGPPPDPEPGKP